MTGKRAANESEGARCDAPAPAAVSGLASVCPRSAEHESAACPAPPSAMLQGRERELAHLLARISRADQEALAVLYHATRARVYGLACRLLGEQAAADDITSEVYMQVQRLAASYEPSRGVPSAWLLMLTRSRSLDYLRATAAHQSHAVPLELVAGLPSAEPDPQEASAAAEQRDSVQAALATLRPEQREVIESAYYGGLSHREIAARLGQPLGTIKARLRTGITVLRGVLTV
jgi:RNA polymerase sigma-70 factor, ECF subfamily